LKRISCRKMCMTVITKTLQIKTKGELQMINITEDVSKIVKESKISNGIVTVFVPGSTAAVTTIEYEPGLLKDFPEMLERIAPKDMNYEHENMWHDGNGHSHVRASLLGPSLTLPFTNKQLTLGTWQQIVLVELDIRSRDRSLVVQIIGE
ncbi:MAG: secondary thiamine-phosphate synthase enzyme YjbQ, partial [Nitrososphaerales archaeon]